MFSRWMATALLLLATTASAGGEDFYQLKVKTARGKPYAMNQLKGKVVVLANTASKCGYTPQYKDLQVVQDAYGAKGVVVLGMPSNSFNQEDLDASKAADFCELNHGVKFTILEKAPVQGPDMHPLFRFLTTTAPEQGDVAWNFEKFIVSRNGKVTGRFRSKIAPSSEAFKVALEKALAEK